MDAVATKTGVRLRLEPFRTLQASAIAGWLYPPDELFWLAPGTSPPLTPAKIIAWQRPGGRRLVMLGGSGPSLLAYAELNPMRHRAGHLWLGHCIVHPSLRGRGLGRRFVVALLIEAFERMDADRVSLIVFPENVRAIRCYRWCGFETVGEEWHRFGNAVEKSRFLRLEARPPAPQYTTDGQSAALASAYKKARKAP